MLTSHTIVAAEEVKYEEIFKFLQNLKIKSNGWVRTSVRDCGDSHQNEWNSI